MLCLTINGAVSLELGHTRGRNLDKTAEMLSEQGFWFNVDEAAFYKNKAKDSLTTFGSATAAELRPTGAMYYAPEGAKKLFESVGLEFVGLAPGIIDRTQDLVVARKI